MPELLKNMYNPHFYKWLTTVLQEVIPEFNTKFNKAYFSPE
jgi:hypothetical protein